MLKRFIVLVVALLTINPGYAKIYFPAGMTAAHMQSLPPNKKMVGWDIHDVLAKSRSAAKIGYGLKSIPAFSGSLFSLLGSEITGNTGPMEQVWADIQKLPNRFSSNGEVYYHIFNKHNQPKLAQKVAKIASLYEPQPGMELIVQSLKAQGIEERIASNIGPIFFDILKDTFKNKYHSNIFENILPGKVVDYNHLVEKQLINPDLVTSFEKPQLAFYQDFNVTYNRFNKKYIIFIDDKVKNVKAATNAGWIGIHFKNVDQLRADLATLGITV